MADRNTVVLGATRADAEQYAVDRRLTGALLLGVDDIPTVTAVTELHVTRAARSTPTFREAHRRLANLTSKPSPPEEKS